MAFALGRYYNTVTKETETQEGSDGAVHVNQNTLLAHERNPGTSNAFGVCVGEWNITHIAASQTDVAVSSGAPALLKAVIMDTGQSGAVTLKDGTTTIQGVTPGANTRIDYGGVKFNDSLIVTTAASAGCVIIWRPQ